MVIDKVQQSSEEMVSDEQGDFHGSIGCTEQTFAVRKVLKKACKKLGNCFMVYMILRKVVIEGT